jgi:predicted nucleic acid-binding protein
VDRPFLDANVLFSAARSASTRLRELWQRPETVLLTSAYCVEEARRNVAVDRPAALADLGALVARLTLVSEPAADAELLKGIELPDKDRPVFLAAVQAKATHFLTGDHKHFGPYRGKTFGGVRIATPADYLGPADKPGK